MQRKNTLVTGHIYHVFNKSIAGFVIFNSKADFLRIMGMLKYYQIENPPDKFSRFCMLEGVKNDNLFHYIDVISKDKKRLVQIVSYCIMPTHLHLVLKQLKKHGISIFMGNILNSYSRYFNTKYKRKGPLWEGRFKNVLVSSDEQLLHLTRYIHLNPVTAYLADKPLDWVYSSYREYLSLNKKDNSGNMCDYNSFLSIKPKDYKKFVEDRISYQRDLAKIKDIILD